MLSNPYKPKKTPTPVPSEYDDDFEVYLTNKNYEDDFEPIDAIEETLEPKKEFKELVQATKIENVKVIQKSLKEEVKLRKDDVKVTKTTPLPVRKKETAGPKISKRQQDLRNLIQLDFCIYDLFEMPVLSEYELYMRTYGQKSSHQQSQTKEDFLDQELQTEDWNICDRWTQCPPHQLIDAGEANPAIAGKQKRQKPKLQEAEFDSVSLSLFLEKSFKVVNTLLMEKEIQENGEIEDDTVVFKNQEELVVPAFVHGIVSFIEKIDSTSIVVVWTLEKHIQGAKTALIVYHLTDRNPKKMLICFPTITCLCINESSSNLIFGGTKDGSIQVWDLKEPDRMHSIYQGYHLRFPSVITDCLLPLKSSHANSIVYLKKHSTEIRDQTQISSIDQDGLVKTWVLVINKIVMKDDSDSSRFVKIIAGESWNLPSVKPMGTTVHQATYFAKESRYLIASDCGIVYQYSKFQTQCFPKKFQAIRSSMMPSHLATCIEPFFEKYFIAGYDDGMVCLFSLQHAVPILKWSLPQSIVQIQISPTRSSVFFVLDSSGCISIWDLSETNAEPKYQMEVEGCVSFQVVAKGSIKSIVYLGFENGSLVNVDLSHGLSEQVDNEVKSSILNQLNYETILLGN